MSIEPVGPVEPLAPGMGRCDITGQVVPEDELVTINGQRVCAEGKQILLDRLKAGEAMPGELDRPSALLRIGCWFIDGLVLALPYLAVYLAVLFALGVTIVAGAPRGSTLFTGILTLVFPAMGITYFGLMHGLRGQSLGKMAGRIKVVRIDGRPMDLQTGFIRALAYQGVSLIGGLVMFTGIGPLIIAITVLVDLYYLADAVTAFVDRSTQRAIHDRIAGTRVIKVAA